MKRIPLWFRRQSLQKKLIMAFLLTILIALALNISLYSQSSQIAASVSTIYESNISLSSLRETLVSIHSNLYAYLSGNYKSLNSYYSERQRLTNSAASLNDRSTDNPARLAEKNIRGLLFSYIERADSAVAGHRGTDVAQYGADYEEAVQIYRYLQAVLNTLNEERFAENTVSYQLLLETQRYTQKMNLFIVALMTMAELAVLIVFTRQSMRPLVALSERATQVGHGQLDLPQLEVTSGDEIGQVTEAFNAMTIRLNEYIHNQQEAFQKENRLKEEQLRLEALLKDAQLGALQAQINPHFLYNTLNAGSQLAMLEGAERTCQFVSCVADYFRYNLRRSGKDVTLQEELEQADNYFFIINTRFAGEIKCIRQIPNELPPVSLPGMVLQPIVENAISHGLHDQEGEKRLTFSVTEEATRVIVSVKDNGCGMPQEMIDRFLAPTVEPSSKPDDQHGIGLANVISRLRLYFGRDDVMEIISGGDFEGTEVRILIPKGACSNVSDHTGG
ncbi:MAG: sensor histidine kinase [Eubacteriales bacterium]|nr:sensor histidine kinase [Eubacteriales bacterium]